MSNKVSVNSFWLSYWSLEGNSFLLTTLVTVQWYYAFIALPYDLPPAELTSKSTALSTLEAELCRVHGEVSELKTELVTAEHHLGEMAEDLDSKVSHVAGLVTYVARWVTYAYVAGLQLSPLI